jgi:phosphatidylglycerol:prolipoprotein diacylglycerol transferase
MGPIRFPNLGWEFNLPTGFHIGSFEIRFYGLIIALGLLAGAMLAYHEAKRTGQKVDDYIDYTFFAVIGALLCARIYYVAFEWDYYSQHPKEIIDIRGGGIAIYGAVIGGAIALLIFSKVKKLKFFKMADTIIPGLLIGQIIGRWGNFFNREAFGGFTDNLLAMQLPLKDVAADTVNSSMMVMVDGVQYVQVHPTFLYESVLNLIVLALILVFRDKKKFYGETLCRYFIGYGIVRFFVEGLRTDQLQFGNGLAVSQILSIVLVVIGLGITIFMHVKLRGKESILDPIPVKGKGEEAETEVAVEEAEKTTEVVADEEVEEQTETVEKTEKTEEVAEEIEE